MPHLLPLSNSSKQRIKLVVAYDGSDFFGWARQKNLRSVQGTLESALFKILKEHTPIWASSRTDAGAHAQGQVCHFDSPLLIPSLKWKYIINNSIDEDCRILSSCKVPSHFHSRFCALYRHYCYSIGVGQPDPFKDRYRYTTSNSLDLPKMQQAAALFVGIHDFRAFSEEIPLEANCIRKLFDVQIKAAKQEIKIDIKGTAFLKGMMRRISGALFEVGSHKRSLEEINHLLNPKLYHQLTWPVVLPAKGLTLIRVPYGRHPKNYLSK